MRQRGVIIKKDSNILSVQIQDPARTCVSCKACVSLTPERPPEDYVVSVNGDHDEYIVGDEVIVEGKMSGAIKAVSVLYGIPFVGLFCGYALTHLFLKSDPLSGIGAVIGLLSGAIIARPLARRLAQSDPEFKIVARACS